MKEPTFSICIPNYNYGRYIGDTIQSVLDQSYPHFEIIVADNASTDNSVEVVQSFNDPRIRLVQNRYNVGFGPNLQRATMHARHDFVNLLSSDDQMNRPSDSGRKSWVRSTQLSSVWVRMARAAPVAGSTASRSRVFWSRDWRCTYRIEPSADQSTRAR